MNSLYEKYLLLFTDSCYAGLIFSFNSEVILASMLHFKYNNALVSLISSLGWYTGHLVNYLLGNIFAKIHKARSATDQLDERYKTLQNIYSGNSQYIMLLCSVPYFGSLITTFSGYAKYSLVRFTIFSLVSRLLFLSYKFIMEQ